MANNSHQNNVITEDIEHYNQNYHSLRKLSS